MTLARLMHISVPPMYAYAREDRNGEYKGGDRLALP